MEKKKRVDKDKYRGQICWMIVVKFLKKGKNETDSYKKNNSIYLPIDLNEHGKRYIMD